MEEIRIYHIRPGQIDQAGDLLSVEVIEALRAGAPLTTLVAVLDGVPAGAIAGGIEEDYFRIEWLYVPDAYRRKGIGKKLLEAIEDILEEERYFIRADYTAIGANAAYLQALWVRNGFAAEAAAYPKSLVGFLGDVRVYLAYNGADKAEKYEIHPFAEIPAMAWNMAMPQLEQMNAPMPMGGFSAPSVLQDVSMCVLSKNRLCAYISVEQAEAGLLEVSAIWSELSDPRILMRMVSAAVEKAREKFTDNTPLLIVAINRTSEKMAKGLIENMQMCSYSYVKM